MGKSTISMAIFNSYVTNYQRVPWDSSPQSRRVQTWDLPHAIPPSSTTTNGLSSTPFSELTTQSGKPVVSQGKYYCMQSVCKWMQMVSNGGFSTSIIYNYVSLLEDIEVTITKRYFRSIFSCTAANLLMWSGQFKDKNNRKFVILHASFLSNHFWFDSFEIISQ
jgi:hypothetical protein